MKNKVTKVNDIYLMKPIEKSNVQCNYDAVAKLHGTAALTDAFDDNNELGEFHGLL